MTEQSMQKHYSWKWFHRIIFVGIALGILFIQIPAGASTPVERTFRIEAKRFEYQPAVINVNPGDRVTIELVATDVVHGLSVDGYDIETTADPGHVAKLSFIASYQGTFRLRCTATCGNLHPFMTGKLQVGSNTYLLRSILLVAIALIAAIMKS